MNKQIKSEFDEELENEFEQFLNENEDLSISAL